MIILKIVNSDIILKRVKINRNNKKIDKNIKDKIEYYK
jgi:hypothetical protein